MESRRPASVVPPQSDSPPLPQPPPIEGPSHFRFRFSLRTLLLIVTGLAILMGLGVTAPQLLKLVLAAVFAALPAVLTIGVVYGQGDFRAFCIGGLFPAGTKMLGQGVVFDSFSSFSRGLWSLAMLAELFTVAVSVVAVGVLCIWVRRTILHRFE